MANLSPLSIVGKTSNIRWDRDGTGNYWSDYKGYDLDGNGRGDVAFRIQNLFEHLEGNRPRLRLYFFSPVADALAAAEHSFPLIRGSREFDHYPLMKAAELGFGITETLDRDRNGERGAAAWAGVPASMLVIAAAVMWKGRRR